MITEHILECRWESQRCICDELRACEQRVRMEDDDYAYVAAQAEADGRWRGWDEALDAAREAVVPQNVRSAYLVSLSPQEQRIAVSALELAARAIDALRNPPSLPPTTGRAHKY